MSFAYILVFKRKTKILKKPIFESKWGALYENVSTKSKLHVMFFFLYILRRLIYVTLAFNWDEQVVFQLVPVMLMNTFFLVYQGQIKPLEGRVLNQVELMNEFLVGCCTFYALCFTDWVQSQSDQAYYGYHMIYVLGMLILINLIIILYFSGRIIFLLINKSRLILERAILKIRNKSVAKPVD